MNAVFVCNHKLVGITDYRYSHETQGSTAAVLAGRRIMRHLFLYNYYAYYIINLAPRTSQAKVRLGTAVPLSTT